MNLLVIRCFIVLILNIVESASLLTTNLLLTVFMLTYSEDLHGWRNDKFSLDFNLALHIMIVVIGIPLKLRTLLKVAWLGLVRHLPIKVVRAVINDELLSLLIENGQINMLIAQ